MSARYMGGQAYRNNHWYAGSAVGEYVDQYQDGENNHEAEDENNFAN